MHTEKEAKEKICMEIGKAIAGNTDDPVTLRDCTCIGSQCMAWRWDTVWESATEDGMTGNVTVKLKRLQGEPKRGYCGLSGAPSQ